MGKEYDVDLLISYELFDGSFYNDYAILRVSDYQNSIPVKFAMDAHPGDTVFSIGFPGGVNTPSIAQGVILNMNYWDCILTDAFTAPGSSGGVLTNDKGYVLRDHYG